MTGLRLDARERLIAIPVALLLALALVFVLDDGGFSETTWYPGALFVLGLLVAVLIAARPRRSEQDRLLLWALAAYAAYCAWAYLSIIWAVVPARAWDAANRDVLYGLALLITVLRPWSFRLLGLLVFAVGGLIALVAAGTLVDTALRDDIRPMFIEGRLSLPMGYANATANLFVIGWFPLIGVVARPGTRWWLRVLAGAGGTLVLCVSLLSQSRGAVGAVALVAILFVVFAPYRWPALLSMLASAAGTAVAVSAIFDVRNAADHAELSATMGDARVSVVIACLVTAVLVAAGVVVAERARERGIDERGLRRTGDRALLGLAAVAVLGALIAIGNPVTFAQDRWADFKSDPYNELALEDSRFTGTLGSERYDFYRVALDEFTSQPVRGVGADSFGPSYLVLGRSDQQPRYAHSLAMAALAETGIVGAGLLAAFIALMAVLAARALRRAHQRDRLLVLGALGGVLVFFIHAMADWLWQFPALGLLAFVLCGAAVRAGQHRPSTSAESGLPGDPPSVALERRRAARAHDALWVGGLSVVALALAFSLALPGIAARFVSSAYDQAATDASGAVHRLNRAASLNPLTADPLLTKAILLRRLHRPRDAETALNRAIKREPDSWFAHMELGMIRLQQGKRASGRAAMERALRLNPRQIVLIDAVRKVRQGQPIDPERVEAVLNRQTQARLAATG